MLSALTNCESRLTATDRSYIRTVNTIYRSENNRELSMRPDQALVLSIASSPTETVDRSNECLYRWEIRKTMDELQYGR